jgi:polysaccharide biosynthesis protein PslJ
VAGHRLRPPGELIFPAAGAALLLLVSVVAVRFSGTLALEVSAVVLVLIGSVAAFLTAPHKALAATIVLFAFLPALKVFITPAIGGVKDVIDLGAIIAAAILIGFERRPIDRWVASLVALFMALYVLDIGGGHGNNWVQGVRLTGEPMLLLIVGFVLPGARRNLRWGLAAFAGTGVLVALYGILQQAIGVNELAALGYSYGDQIRTVGSFLRSFGTLDDPFSYASFLYFAVAAAFFYLRRGWLLWVTEFVLLIGLGSSFVRTAALILLGYACLAAIHRRLAFPAMSMVAAVMLIAVLTLSKSSGVTTQTLSVYYTNGGSQLIARPVNDPGSVLLNGRVSAWKAAVGDRPLDWIFGRGVGEVGTAAARASVGTFTTAGTTSTGQTSNSSANTAVDSGYLATVADVGIVGLLIQLALFGRLIVLGVRRARAGSIEGWMPLTFLAALLLDALTRASFTGFPGAFLGFLMVGVALAAFAESDREGQAAPAAMELARNSSIAGATSVGVRPVRQASP